MRQIERNPPCFVDDIQVNEVDGLVVIKNRRTGSYSSGAFRPSAENIESAMKQCFEAGQRAKAAELRAVLGIA